MRMIFEDNGDNFGFFTSVCFFEAFKRFCVNNQIFFNFDLLKAA